MPTGIYTRTKPVTLETRRKISERKIGTRLSEDTKLKIGIANKGKHNSPATEFKKGVTLSREIIEKRAKNHSKEKNHRWIGGRFKREGYVFVMDENSRRKEGYTREHILVMEQKLGRKLKPKEVVHHIDFDTENNDISNLHLFSSNGYHLNYHRNLRNIIREELLGNL